MLAVGGNRTSGPLDVATPCLANSSPHGRQDFASETFITCFHLTQDPISSEDGLKHALGTGSSGGCATAAVAFTKSKRAQSNTDDESWVPGEVTPTMSCFDQGDTRATTVVAFTQNTRDEVRKINGDGQRAGALSAESGSHQTNYVAVAIDLQNVTAGGDLAGTLDTTRPSRVGGQAVAFTTEQTPKFKEEIALTLTKQSPSGGGQPQCVAFANRTRDGIKVPEGMQGDAVHTPMAVRRLTPRECERLQGFPDDYTLVTYRGKPACDGPRYRALGNSMAVPVMRWIGERIAKVNLLSSDA